MRGPDATLRAKGARLVDQLRRDELPAYAEAREREAVCGSCKGSGRNMWNRYEDLPCDRCGGDPRAVVQCDPLDVARLLAFCGDEEAHDVADWSKGEFVWDTWPEALHDLCAKLPPKRVEVACGNCEGTTRAMRPAGPGGGVWGGPGSCPACRGTGKVTHDTTAERWLLVVAAEAVARECLQEVAEHEKRAFVAFGRFGLAESRSRHGDTFAQREALDACLAWIAEPTPDRERAWILVVVDSDGYPAWLPTPQNWQGLRPNLAAPILAAADVLGPDRVREIASRAIREAVRR